MSKSSPLLFLFLFSVYLTSNTVYAQDIETIHAWKPSSLHKLQQQFLAIVEPTALNPLELFLHTEQNAKPATHLRILYESERPVPVRYGPYGTYDVDSIAAILPPSEGQEVLLPLTLSPGWNHKKGGYFIDFYGRKDTPPTFGFIREEYRLGFFGTGKAYARQLFQRQFFGISTANFLLGYRVGNFSITLLFGIAILLFTGGFLVFHKKGVVYAFSITALSSILLSNIYMSTDYTLATLADQIQWQQHGTYKQVGDNYGMARWLDNHSKEKQFVNVYACGELHTLLRYFLFPISVKATDERWERATHAILSPPWQRIDGIIHCKGLQRPGKILATFDEGGAVVEFDPPLE